MRDTILRDTLYKSMCIEYKQFLDGIGNFIVQHGASNDTAASGMRRLMIESGNGMFLYGSDAVIRAYIEMRDASTDPAKDKMAVLVAFAKVAAAMRTDIVNEGGAEGTDMGPSEYIKVIRHELALHPVALLS